MNLKLLSGFAYSMQGLKLISQPQLRAFVIIPLCINIALFSAATIILYLQFNHWLDALLPNFPNWLSWLEDLIMWFVLPMFSIMILFISFYSFSFIANLIAAPFNNLLAEKTEQFLRGETLEQTSSLPPLSLVKSSILSEIGKLFYLLKWSILLLIISFIPLINIISPFLWLLFGAWMLALEYLDYPISNHGLYFKDLKNYIFSNKNQSVGFGFGVLLFTSLPILNFFAMPAAVCGAAALYTKTEANS